MFWELITKDNKTVKNIVKELMEKAAEEEGKKDVMEKKLIRIEDSMHKEFENKQILKDIYKELNTIFLNNFYFKKTRKKFEIQIKNLE